ncbi:hypothetical protein MGSAQ_002981, partial [marine sediment metagenome]
MTGFNVLSDHLALAVTFDVSCANDLAA